MGEQLRTMGSIDKLEMLSASESLETPSIAPSQRAELNKDRWKTQLSWELAFAPLRQKYIHSVAPSVGSPKRGAVPLFLVSKNKSRIFLFLVLNSFNQTYL